MTNKCRLLTVRKVEGKGDNHLGFDFEIRGEKQAVAERVQFSLL